MKELWLPVKDSPGYEVSNLGRVRSLDRLVPSNNQSTKFNVFHKGQILKANLDGYGYPSVRARSPKVRARTIKVHILVAQAFIPNPDNKPQINHKDGNKLNNHVDNLEWCTAKENMQHAYENKLIDLTKRPKPKTIVTEEIVRMIRDKVNNGVSRAELANLVGVGYGTICSIVSGRSWKNIAAVAFGGGHL